MAKKILMLIAPDQFRDEELLVPRQILSEAGWTVETASTQTGVASGMLGATEAVKFDLAYAQAEAQKQAYEAVIVVGGMGSPEYLWENAQVHQLLQTLNQQHRLIAAICLSGAVLAKAGLLNGKLATVWDSPDALAVFKSHQVSYTGDPVTVDGRFVTANGPEAAEAFAQTILTQLKNLTPSV